MEFGYGERALADFSFEEEARLFLRPGGGVGLVVLDPLLQGEAEAVNRIHCVKRERFVGFFLRKGASY